MQLGPPTFERIGPQAKAGRAADQASPRRDRSSAPFLGRGVAHGLGELPAMAAQILNDARPLPTRYSSAKTYAATTRASRSVISSSYLEGISGSPSSSSTGSLRNQPTFTSSL